MCEKESSKKSVKNFSTTHKKLIENQLSTNNNPKSSEKIPSTQVEYDQKPSENTIFLSAVKDVAPLPKKFRATMPRSISQPTTITNSSFNSLPVDDTTIKFVQSKQNEYVEGHIIGFESELFSHLKAGNIRPEARLNLHGLTIQHSFHTVIKFLHAAYTNRYRSVLIIPGRGNNSPQGISILKEKLYEWFVQEPLKRVILAFCTATICDGGTGALYLFLRKYKKTWTIYWKQQPLDIDLL